MAQNKPIEETTTSGNAGAVPTPLGRPLQNPYPTTAPRPSQPNPYLRNWFPLPKPR